MARDPASRSARPAVAKDRDFVTAVSRGIAVLMAFTPYDVWLGNAEIAARTGLPKATISRLTRTLTDKGYLRYSPRLRQYRLGVGVLALGYSTLEDFDVRKIARPKMQLLANRLNGVVGLAARDGFDLIYLETCHSITSIVSLRLEPGTRVSILDNAVGRALLSALPEEERASLLRSIETQYGSRWQRFQPAMAQSLDSVRQQGFCLTFGRWQEEVNVVGVPLPLAGEAPLALGVAGFSGQLSRARLRDEVGPLLVEIAQEISTDLAKLSPEPLQHLAGRVRSRRARSVRSGFPDLPS